MKRARVIIIYLNLEIIEIIKSKYIGMYIHGSYAEGTFKWERSDIDIIVLINNKLSVLEKEQLLDLFVNNSQECPKKGIEISFLNIYSINIEKHPFSYEFHYSLYWYSHIEENLWQIKAERIKYDPDLASHIMNLWTHSVVIESTEVENIFPKIKDSEFIDSIENTLIDNVDAIMNLCRKHYYIRYGKLLSKYEGLTWAINEFTQFSELLLHIEDLYNENKSEINIKYLESTNDFWKYLETNSNL